MTLLEYDFYGNICCDDLSIRQSTFSELRTAPNVKSSQVALSFGLLLRWSLNCVLGM